MKTVYSILMILLLIIVCIGCGHTAQDHIDLGLAKFNLADDKGAIAEYNMALEIDNDNSDAYSGRGYARTELLDYNGAIADFNKAIEINHMNANAYSGRGVTKIFLKDFNSAIDDFNKAIKINPYSADPYAGRGGAKIAIQDYIGAITDCTKAIEINTKAAKAFYYCYRGIAKALNYTKNKSNNNLEGIDRGIDDLTCAINIDPKQLEAYYWRGIIKIGLNQRESGCLDLGKSGELGFPLAYEAIKNYCQ